MAALVMGVKERLRSKSRHLQLPKPRSIEDKTLQLPSPIFSEWDHTNTTLLPRTLRQEALATPEAEQEIVFQTPPVETEQDDESQDEGEDGGSRATTETMTTTTTTPPTDINHLVQSVQGIQLMPSPTQPEQPQPASPQLPLSVQTALNQSKEAAFPTHNIITSTNTKDNSITASSLPARTTGSVTSRRTSCKKHIPLASTSPILDQYEANNSNNVFRQDNYISSSETPPPPSPSSATSSSIATVATAATAATTAASKFSFPISRQQSHNTGTGNQPRRGRQLNDLATHERYEHSSGSIDLNHRSPTPTDTQTQQPQQQQQQQQQQQACIYRQTTEIIQKGNDSREVHVNHRYEFLQPLKFEAIQPVKHWLLNSQTGEKTEIPEPEGWVAVPETMRPRSKQGSSSESGTPPAKTKSRRYVISSNEHLNGNGGYAKNSAAEQTTRPNTKEGQESQIYYDAE